MTDTKTKYEHIRTQPITSMETAIRIYYTYPELENKHIKELFGIAAQSALARYKKPVLEAQAEQGVRTMRSHAVNTEVAYKVWGIDVHDLEKRRKKLKELGFSA